MLKLQTLAPNIQHRSTASHSERRLVAGFAIAAFIAWKLIVTMAMSITNIEPVAKIDQLSLILYG